MKIIANKYIHIDAGALTEVLLNMVYLILIYMFLVSNLIETMVLSCVYLVSSACNWFILS